MTDEQNPEDYQTIHEVLLAYVYLLEKLENKNTSLARLRKLLFGASNGDTLHWTDITAVGPDAITVASAEAVRNADGRAAERFRIEQDRARQLGQLYDAPSVRFGDFLAGWLGRHERRVRPSTFERAQSLRRFHVLSRYYVEEVTAARVEEIVMAGGTRQGHALRLIKRVLTDARARGQRVHEPVFAIEPPRTRRAIRDS